MATIQQWDYFNRHVQSGLQEGRYINAKFTLIAAGPPVLDATGYTGGGSVGDVAFPVGILQSYNFGQNSQVMRLFEIGSERSYFIRGRTVGNLGLGRIMYHGPNLLRALYAYLKSPEGSPVEFDSLYDSASQLAQLNTSGHRVVSEGGKSEYHVSPGSDNLWFNLESDVFSQPIGLLLLIRDSNGDTVGAFYFECCHVVNHGVGTDAGGTIMSENAAIVYDRIVPVSVETVSLIKNADSIVGKTVASAAVGAAI